VRRSRSLSVMRVGKRSGKYRAERREKDDLPQFLMLECETL